MGKLSGGGADSGGSGAYPGWVGYIEYDDETGEAIAADYSGLEMGGTVPNSLRFNKIKFRGDWKGSIGKFANGSNMFYQCSNLTSFSGDLSSLTDGTSMFNGCTNLSSFTSDLSSLTNCPNMFSYCSNLTSFNADLPSLIDGGSMFSGCKLDAASVERILNTIPEYTDGSSHTLAMVVQSGEAASKFGEITGTTPNFAIRNVNFKGWTITVNYKK